jgi:TctA family transporter
MQDLLHNLILGFSVALTLQNLRYCFAGVFLGTLIGVLPGIGSLATIAMLLPLMYADRRLGQPGRTSFHATTSTKSAVPSAAIQGT